MNGSQRCKICPYLPSTHTHTHTHTLTRIYPLAALQQAVLSFTAKSAHNVDALYFKSVKQKKILKAGCLAKDFDCKRRWILSDSGDVILVEVMTAYLEVLLGFYVQPPVCQWVAQCTKSFVSTEHLYVVSVTFHRLKQVRRRRVHSKSVLIFSLCS